MHPTIEFNCRLSALFLNDPTGSAVFAAYPFLQINAVAPGDLQLIFMRQTPD
jgi:hypothetical protein